MDKLCRHFVDLEKIILSTTPPATRISQGFYKYATDELDEWNNVIESNVNIFLHIPPPKKKLTFIKDERI